jgi:hypothetical protein
MIRGRPYSPCKLFIDGRLSIETGDYIKTSGGSAYLVQTIRQNKNRPHRKHLSCLRWPVDEIPAGAKVYPLYWYKRNHRRK